MPQTGLAQFDNAPFGPAIATEVAKYLKHSNWMHNLGAIVRSHWDYTGHGLFRDHATGVFFISASQDSIPIGAPFLTFSDETNFVE